MQTQLKKLIIFDFDGVLADSFNTFYPLLRDAMKHIDLPLTPNQYRNLFADNFHQGLKDFIGDDKKYKVAMEFRSSNYDKYYYNKRYKVKLFPGTIKFLKEVSKNYVLTIASSGREDNIKNLLSKNKVANLFSLILANTATSKEGMIKKIIGEFKAKRQETIMITDTVGDIKVAQKNGLETIAVTWGFHNKESAATAKPNYIVSNFKELISILNN